MVRSIVDYNLSSLDGITYMYYTQEPQFEFGAGLSYTTFSLTWFSAGADVARVDSEAFSAACASAPPRECAAAPSYAVNITNSGNVVSDVSVLAFLQGTGEPDTPLRQLFDFERVAALAPGQTATVIFPVPLAVAASARADGSTVLRAGARGVAIGLPGQQMLRGRLEVVGARLSELTPPLPDLR